MKDADYCEKPRGVVIRRNIRGCPNGETQQAKSLLLVDEKIVNLEGTT